MRDGNLLSALMIACDGHDGALSAAPNPRHHFHVPIRKCAKYQIDSELRGMIHNHPSGSPEPSRADIHITQKIAEAGHHLGISVHDHVVIGREGHVSLRQRGLL